MIQKDEKGHIICTAVDVRGFEGMPARNLMAPCPTSVDPPATHTMGAPNVDAILCCGGEG